MAPPPVLIGSERFLYREVLAGTLRALRPDLVVHDVPAGELDAAVHRARPWLVICSALTVVVEECAPAWILLHPEHDRLTTVSVAGERRTMPHPTIDVLLRIIDEVLAVRPLPDGGG